MDFGNLREKSVKSQKIGIDRKSSDAFRNRRVHYVSNRHTPKWSNNEALAHRDP